MSGESRFQQAMRTSAELNAASDDLNGALERFEAALKGLKLGITATVPVSGSLPAGKGILHWRKFNNEWRLLFEVDGDDESRLLSHASRENRLRAIDELPKLVQALLEGVDGELQRVRTARDTVDMLTEVVTSATASK